MNIDSKYEYLHKFLKQLTYQNFVNWQIELEKIVFISSNN